MLVTCSDDLQQGISRKLGRVCQFKNEVLWQFTLEGDVAPVLQIPVNPHRPSLPKLKFEISEEKKKENKAKAA